MNMDIFVVIMCVVFVAVGIWALRIERGGSGKDVGAEEKKEHSSGKDERDRGKSLADQSMNN